MLTKLVVGTYKTFVEIALWAFVLIGGIVGASTGNMTGHGFLGFVIGAATCFFGMAIFFGAALILQDIHERVKEIESHLNNRNKGSNLSASNCNFRTKQATYTSRERDDNSQNETNRLEIKCPNCGAVYPGQRAGSLCKCGMKLK